MTHQELYKVWENVNHIGGWLRLLEMGGGFTAEEIKELEDIDEEAIATEQEAKEYYYSKELPKVKAEVEAFVNYAKEKNPEWVRKTRLYSLIDLLAIIDREIKESYELYLNQKERDVPYFLRRAIFELKNIPKLEEKRRRVRSEIYFLNQKKDVKSRVNEIEIDKALNFPFEQLIQPQKRIRQGEFFSICPNHDEKKPSFYVKNNWGFCFGCGYSCDTIRFLMDRDNLSFPLTVKKLQ